jgi:hypothetical protein
MDRKAEAQRLHGRQTSGTVEEVPLYSMPDLAAEHRPMIAQGADHYVRCLLDALGLSGLEVLQDRSHGTRIAKTHDTPPSK